MEVKPGYKRTEVGVIPKDWEVAFIGDKTTKVGSGAGTYRAGDAASGDAAYKPTHAAAVGRVPSRGVDEHLKKMGAVWK